jgi:DMSO reductase family type II enzyme chaperone
MIPAEPAAGPPRPARTVSGRQVADTAAPRCLCYAACSELLASPHEVDPRPALRERAGLGGTLPYAGALEPLFAEVCAADLGRLQAEYSGLFEVGSQGPPAPIREDLQTGQRAGIREEVVRFYDYFGYVLDARFAWQPDHLSVQLEFMHYLCYREAQAGEGPEALSFQLAQADFAARHLVTWVPQLAANVDRIAAGSLYARAVAAVRDFIRADAAWQAVTISSPPDEAGPGRGGVQPESSPRVSGRAPSRPGPAGDDGGVP